MRPVMYTVLEESPLRPKGGFECSPSGIRSDRRLPRWRRPCRLQARVGVQSVRLRRTPASRRSIGEALPGFLHSVPRIQPDIRPVAQVRQDGVRRDVGGIQTATARRHVFANLDQPDLAVAHRDGFHSDALAVRLCPEVNVIALQAGLKDPNRFVLARRGRCRFPAWFISRAWRRGFWPRGCTPSASRRGVPECTGTP